MPKFKHKGDMPMLKDEILEKIFTNKETRLVPIGYQSTMVSVFEDVLTEYVEENPNAELSELLSV